MNLVALRALRAAANLATVAGDAELLDYCRRRDRALTEAIARRFWSEEHKGWRENIEPSAEAKEFIASKNAGRTDDPWQKIQISMSGNRQPTVCTRHGNALAVLLKLGTPEQQTAAADLVVRAFDPKETAINNGMSPLWTDKIFGAMFEGGRDGDAVRLLQGSYGTWATNGALHWGEGFGPGDASQTCGSSVNWLLTSLHSRHSPHQARFCRGGLRPASRRPDVGQGRRAHAPRKYPRELEARGRGRD